MIAIVALQRKLLILIYTLWKKDEGYDELYYKTSREQKTKPSLPHEADRLQKEIGRSLDLPIQDELLSEQSTEDLLCHMQCT